MSVTVHDLAIYRLDLKKGGELTPEQYVEAGFGINGTCEICGINLAPEDAYPIGGGGFWTCSDHSSGAFATVKKADSTIFG